MAVWDAQVANKTIDTSSKIMVENSAAGLANYEVMCLLSSE